MRSTKFGGVARCPPGHASIPFCAAASQDPDLSKQPAVFNGQQGNPSPPIAAAVLLYWPGHALCKKIYDGSPKIILFILFLLLNRFSIFDNHLLKLLCRYQTQRQRDFLNLRKIIAFFKS